MITLTDLMEKLKATVDEVSILELLNLTTADIVDRFEDVIEENYDRLVKEFDEQDFQEEEF
jgi:hypothetical protein